MSEIDLPRSRGRPPNPSTQRLAEAVQLPHAAAVNLAETEALKRELYAFKTALREATGRLASLAHTLKMIAEDTRIPLNVRTLARIERERNGPY